MKIYVSHSREFDFENELYKPIEKSDFYSKHLFIFPHKKSQEPFQVKELFEFGCDLVIAEVSHPSTGQGIELGWADDRGIDIFALYKKGNNSPSSSVKIVCENVVEYVNSRDMVDKIEAFFEKA